MTKAKAKELSEILKAYSEGKTIQRKSFTDNSFNDITLPWLYGEISEYEYRIKPKFKSLPFTFEDGDLFKDKWVIYNEDGTMCKIIGFDKNNVYFKNWCYTYEEMLRMFTFEDGSPCGKHIEIYI